MDLEKLGSYRIIGTLGVGAMGVVYKAVHEQTGKLAALKVISSETAQRGGKAFERFKREAEILQQLRHSNIVRILAVGKSKGSPYIAMELIEGATLEEVLKKRGELPWKEVVALGKQICDALHYAHEHGVVHRDLKPSNLMVTRDDRIKLTDFGIAKDLDATALTATGRTMGTAAYMAPEQIRGTPDVSHKTDLYSLGIVLYQMLTGSLPFEGNSHIVLMHAHINAPIPRASDKLAEIPRALDDLIVKLMAKDHSDRPWDAAAVGEVLNEILEKASKGQTVPMVWPSEGADPLAPTIGTGPIRTSSGSSASGAVVTPKKKPKKRRSAPVDNRTASERWRARLGTAGLVAIAASIALLIYFFGFKKPSQESLFQSAEKLMASPDREDWEYARKYYLDPLDQNYPDHPYQDQTREWRDKLLLRLAEARFSNMERFKNPATETERRIMVCKTEVEVAQKRHDDVKAVELWNAFIADLKPEVSEDDRQWFLFAKTQSDALEEVIKSRTSQVRSLAEKAYIAVARGDLEEARILVETIRRDYGMYPEVQHINLPNLPPPPTEPESTPENPAP
ncbi:MAG: serine/threonine protein kinase [Isosphaeraceae bacterium]